MLWPIGILLAVLTLGGALSVVFSIREQRRISQLHELTVSSELSAQRRTEQTYNTFLEGSQKTLTLVNDTLTLAKEASEQAAHTMDRKASANLSAIERAAEDLMLGIIETGDFERVVDIPEHRSRIQALVQELSALEGYRVLQDVDLKPYSRFITAIEQLLRGDAKSARQVLRHAAQDGSGRQLQRFAQYWAAKLSSAFGEYDQARGLYEQAKRDAPEGSVEHWELERVLLENEFFQAADSQPENARPGKRLATALPTLRELEQVAAALEEKTKSGDGQHANHEVAVTRANIYTWIAHRPDHLFEPILPAPQDAKHKPAQGSAFDRTVSISNESEQLEKVRRMDDHALRVWSLRQAQRIYAHQHDLHASAGVDFALMFGRAECHFALHEADDIREYHDLEQKVRDEQVGAHREHRWAVELRQIALIGKARLLRHERMGEVEQGHGKTEVEAAYTRLLDALDDAPEHDHLRFFSHLQRRNLTAEQLRTEACALRDEALGRGNSGNARS